VVGVISLSDILLRINRPLMGNTSKTLQNSMRFSRFFDNSNDISLKDNCRSTKFNLQILAFSSSKFCIIF
jgi:hypothetical protein